MVLVYDLLEDRCMIDVIITVFSLCFKIAESLENLDQIVCDCAKDKIQKVLSMYWTGSRSKKKKDKAVSFRKWSRKKSPAVSVGSRARLNHAQNLSWWTENHCFTSNLTNPINKMFLRLIYLTEKFNFSQCQSNCWHTDWCQEWNIKTSLIK